MVAAPLQVLTRPFSIEPVTHLMLPDGIFDNAIHHLRIACHVTNTSATDLTNVQVYLEGASDPGIGLSAKTHLLARVPAGASVLVAWDADFEHAVAGKPRISVIARADGFQPRRSLRQIFVTQTRYDTATESWTCEVDEGIFTMSKVRVIGPSDEWAHAEAGEGPGRECHCPPDGPFVPIGFTASWAPNPGYEGTHGELPFSDPWWKVLALIILVLAVIVGLIAAALGAGTFSIGVKGKFEETDPSVKCCTPAPKTEFTVAGVAGMVASAALAVACADAADPWWRGQEATPPAAGEKTLGEKVEASWELPQAPNAGEAYTAEVKWNYTRLTTGNSYTHSVGETQANIHLCKDVAVKAPQTVNLWDPLWVNATFTRPDESRFTGPELYGLCVYRSPGPDGLFFVEPLTDDGLNADPAANDGIYASELSIEEAYGRVLAKRGLPVEGKWRVFLYAQDVNLTKPGEKPEVAAQTIGGFVVASALTLTFDPTLPCPITAQAIIEVL